MRLESFFSSIEETLLPTRERLFEEKGLLFGQKRQPFTRARDSSAGPRSPRRAAGEARRVHFDLFRRRLEGQIEGYRFPDEEIALTQYEGLRLESRDP